jgi:serine/threonine-protein phosphatase CPPED1
MSGVNVASAFSLPQLDVAAPWSGLGGLPIRPDEFSFALLSDRTGLARPGVFERAVEVTNLLRPDLVIQVGDMIEGYTEDVDVISRQWQEFDDIAATLEVPLFRTPGNHDVSNEVMRREYLHRHGLLHYHFRYRDVLFLILDTQDPPEPFGQLLDGADLEAELAADRALQRRDPAALARRMEETFDWSGTMPANLSSEQIGWAEEVIGANQDVRWTVITMHMPAWQGEGHPGLRCLRRALGDRPYTVFAGHTHNYRRYVVDGREHIRLGSTGGLFCQDRDEGNFDHVTLVSVGSQGVQIANVMLEGVLGREGGSFRPRVWDDPEDL